MTYKINKQELAQWIQATGKDSLMLTIGKPHAKALVMHLDESHSQHVISRIIELANRYVFGKHKHFIFLNGIVVCEQSRFHPHYHIVFAKPARMEFSAFQTKLSQLADRLCNYEFTFDLTGTDLTKYQIEGLRQPGYSGFAKVSPVHENIGSYLTKQSRASYHMLQGRSFSIERDQLELRVNYKSQQEASYVTRTITSNSGSSIQLQMDPQTGRTITPAG